MTASPTPARALGTVEGVLTCHQAPRWGAHPRLGIHSCPGRRQRLLVAVGAWKSRGGRSPGTGVPARGHRAPRTPARKGEMLKCTLTSDSSLQWGWKTNVPSLGHVSLSKRCH